MLAGLWHAHIGWLFETHGQASSKRFARDLVEDPAMRRINRGFPLIALASLLLPFLLGLALGGGVLAAGLSALLWGGLVRIFLVHHITWSINSICHFFGSRRFDTDDRVHQRLLAGAARRWARPGTTTTTPSRSRPSTGCAGMSSTRPGG